jgi:hypothetical protein
VAFQGLSILIILARGPHCQRYTWLGYEGGYSVKKIKVETKDVEKSQEDKVQECDEQTRRSCEKGGEKST